MARRLKSAEKISDEDVRKLATRMQHAGNLI